MRYSSARSSQGGHLSDTSHEDESPVGRGHQGAIPLRLRVGAVGHRTFQDADSIARAIGAALDRVMEWANSPRDLPVQLAVLSPLAEGADRLIASAVLARPGSVLHAILPLSPEDYVTDFDSSDSRAEFNALLELADEVTVMPHVDSRDEAYSKAGRQTVDKSDVLLAVWDGLPARGRGGTAETISYARTRGLPIVIISSNGDNRITFEPANERYKDLLVSQRTYNSARISPARFLDAATNHSTALATAAKSAGLSEGNLGDLLNWITPFFVRADDLAARYQTKYLAAGTATFLLAAFAVAVAAMQVLFWPENNGLVWVEVAVLIILLGLVLIGRFAHLHERWLAYRFLAERFRSALFLAVVGLPKRRMANVEWFELGHHSEEWLHRSLAEVWRSAPPLHIESLEMQPLSSFLRGAWIEDQMAFHRRASRRHRFRHHFLGRVVYALFAATLMAAILHAAGLPPEDESRFSLVRFLELAAICLPAVAAAVAGIRAQREYERNADRYDRMIHHLERLSEQMQEVSTLEALQGAAVRVENVMLQENQEWFAVMKFHEFDVHV